MFNLKKNILNNESTSDPIIVEGYELGVVEGEVTCGSEGSCPRGTKLIQRMKVSCR